ncbi:MAG: hypothetical protein IJF11_05505 [Clostridia bacterium]|nr:hypothetical protein [Clostridia bacterium]
MDFKDSILKETSVSYRDMLTGNTIRPLIGTYSTDNTDSYSRKRNAYYSRLGQEKSKFNNALSEIQRTERARLATERDVEARKKRDRQRARWVNLPLIFATVLSLVVTLFLIPIGALEWVAEELIPSSSLRYFLPQDIEGEGALSAFITLGLVAVCLVVAIIICTKKFGFVDTILTILEKVNIFILPVGAIAFLIAYFVLRFLLFFLSYLAFALVGSLCPILLFVASIVLMIIFGRKMELKSNRISTIVKIIVAIVLAFVLFGVADSIAMVVGYSIL